MAATDAVSATDLLAILRCPDCRATLHRSIDAIRCAGCGGLWPQRHCAHVDLRPRGWPPDDPGWHSRQALMTDYYEGLRADPEEAANCFRWDFGPFADMLAGYSGDVLEVGGGAGITHSYLPLARRYVAVDPSETWLGSGWDPVRALMGCPAAPTQFVQAVGERLPFEGQTFDVVLCLWTLNHCADPAAAVREMHRVLRPQGRLLLVIEDAEPTWRELLKREASRYPAASRRQLAWWKLTRSGPRWPTQADHVVVPDAALQAGGSLRLDWRWWSGCYLALEYSAPARR